MRELLENLSSRLREAFDPGAIGALLGHWIVDLTLALVVLAAFYGRVGRITLRSTRVVTPDGKMPAVPNTQGINNKARLKDERTHIEKRLQLRERVFAALGGAGVEMPFETIQLAPFEARLAAETRPGA